MNEQLDKYFAGELSEAEKEKFFDRIAADEEDKKEFARMQNTVALSQLIHKAGDDEWATRKLGELKKRIYPTRLRHVIINIMKYAALIAVLLVSTWFAATEYNLRHTEPLFTEIQVPKGQRVYMTFADGTQAWLSPRSSIKIPNVFSRNNRMVELDGEGFFSVAKDPKKPFIVKTKQYNIQVLGTKFNVFAYSASTKFETDLLEGAVHVYNRSNEQEGIYLKPNERVSLQDNRLVKSHSTFNNEEYLKNGIFSFNAKPFGEILNYLSLWYNVTFDVKNAVSAGHLISGKFRQSDDVQNILKALQGAHKFNFRLLSEDRIEIY